MPGAQIVNGFGKWAPLKVDEMKSMSQKMFERARVVVAILSVSNISIKFSWLGSDLDRPI